MWVALACLMSVTFWVELLVTSAILLVACELMYHVARRAEAPVAAARKPVVDAIQGAMLGLLALLLGFTFSIANERYASRKAIIVDEVNAIGTTYLRAKFLPAPHDTQTQNLLREYVALKLTMQTVPRGAPQLARVDALHAKLWEQARAMAAIDPRSQITSLFAVTLNEMIDMHTKRVNVNLYQRIPDEIRWLLYFAAILGFGIVGYASGHAARRSTTATVLLAVAVASVITFIVEFNRPGDPTVRIGLEPFQDLQAQMQHDLAPAAATR